MRLLAKHSQPAIDSQADMKMHRHQRSVLADPTPTHRSQLGIVAAGRRKTTLLRAPRPLSRLLGLLRTSPAPRSTSSSSLHALWTHTSLSSWRSFWQIVRSLSHLSRCRDQRPVLLCTSSSKHPHSPQPWCKPPLLNPCRLGLRARSRHNRPARCKASCCSNSCRARVG